MQNGFCYSLYLLKKYGDKKNTKEFYSKKYLKAFPMAIDDFGEELPEMFEIEIDLSKSSLYLKSNSKTDEFIKSGFVRIQNNYILNDIYNFKRSVLLKYSKNVTPSISNLRFRETPDLKGKFIRSLIKGEKLELIEKGKSETIDGVKGVWVKVKTEKGEIGWCFDAYLEEVK